MSSSLTRMRCLQPRLDSTRSASDLCAVHTFPHPCVLLTLVLCRESYRKALLYSEAVQILPGPQLATHTVEHNAPGIPQMCVGVRVSRGWYACCACEWEADLEALCGESAALRTRPWCGPTRKLYTNRGLEGRYFQRGNVVRRPGI